jgi:hypothetical protein
MARTAHPQPHRARRTLATAATTAALALALAGCSDQEDTSGLPPLATAATPTKATLTGLVLTPEQQAVADAVTRYDTVIKTMSDGAPLDMNKINKVAVDPWATKVGKNLFGLKALKNRTRGNYKSRVKVIKIVGMVASLTACSDSRGINLVSQGPTPTVVAKGSRPMIIKIDLIQEDGKWFVMNLKEVGKC